MSQVTSIQKQVWDAIPFSRDDGWGKKLWFLSPMHQSFWMLQKAIKSDTVSVMFPLVRPNWPPAFDDREKAECLANSLERKCTSNLQPCDRGHVDKADEYVAQRLAQPHEDDAIKQTSLRKWQTYSTRETQKIFGADCIMNKVLTILSAQIIYLLVLIFNALLNGCAYPDQWKEPMVIGIPKSSKQKNLPAD